MVCGACSTIVDNFSAERHTLCSVRQEQQQQHEDQPGVNFTVARGWSSSECSRKQAMSREGQLACVHRYASCEGFAVGLARKGVLVGVVTFICSLCSQQGWEEWARQVE